MTATNHKPNTRHTPHAHRMLQQSAAYLLANGAQTWPQRTKSLWLIPDLDGPRKQRRRTGNGYGGVL